MKLRQIFTKYREEISYILFGILTTAVNYVVYFPLYNIVHFPASLANGIAWVLAVIFAFFVNKIFVFRSKNWSAKVFWVEGIRFAACRIGSGLLETGLLLLMADILLLDGNFWKIIVSVIVVIINYFGSKYLVFRNKKS